METKIDGLSLALRYERGSLVTALTRGDGRLNGEDVTANARVIADVRAELPDAPEYLELRGEVYMENAAFEEVNRRQEEAGKKRLPIRETVRRARCASWIPPSPNRGGSLCLFSICRT